MKDDEEPRNKWRNIHKSSTLSCNWFNQWKPQGVEDWHETQKLHSLMWFLVAVAGSWYRGMQWVLKATFFSDSAVDRTIGFAGPDGGLVVFLFVVRKDVFFCIDRASPGFAKQFWTNYKRWWCLESRSTCIVHVSYTMHIPVNPFGRTVRETVCKKEARIPHDHGSSGCCLAQEFMQLVKLVKLVSWWMTKSLMETRVRSFLFSLHTVDGRNPEHQLNRLQISTG